MSSTGYRNLPARIYPMRLILVVAVCSKYVTLLPNNIKIGESDENTGDENIIKSIQNIQYFCPIISNSNQNIEILGPKLLGQANILSYISGGLFEEANSLEEIAFKYAVDHINRNKELLPRSRVMAQIERVPPHDSFYASKRGLEAIL